jgi:ferrochelatase
VKRAVVLFNLGGPDSPGSVRPFLVNLFSDPAIITQPNPLRWVLARIIAGRRAPLARAIYAKIGGRSPLRENTEAQAYELEEALGIGYRCFIAMRYWHPRSDETAAAVKEWEPDEVILLPLYPQFSTTTTASSLADWERAARRIGLVAPVRALCCYPREDGFVTVVAELVAAALAEAGERPRRILFSAHGLPEKIVAAGDPYQWQVEQTVERVVALLARSGLDWTICYQSRVGKLAWIGPSTDSEIARAGRDGVAVIVVPIAFVSEHSETLVELDIEYRHLAERSGVGGYFRVATVGSAPSFIDGLAALVRRSCRGVMSGEGERICPGSFGRCPMASGAPR